MTLVKEHRFTFPASKIAEAALSRVAALQLELDDEVTVRAEELRGRLHIVFDEAIDSVVCHEVMEAFDTDRRGWLRTPDDFAQPRENTVSLFLTREVWDRFIYVDRRRRELTAKIAHYQAAAARYGSQTQDPTTGRERYFDLDADDCASFGLE